LMGRVHWFSWVREVVWSAVMVADNILQQGWRLASVSG